MAREIDERITAGWKPFCQYSSFLKDQKIPIRLKRKIMDTVILPSMAYGAETWSLTKHIKNKLAVAQRTMEIAMLGITITDKIRNENIRARTKVEDIVWKAIKAKGHWAGHVARMDINKWARKTIERTPRDRRRTSGRPKRRWRDDIEQKTGSKWMQVAQNRQEWKHMWKLSDSSCGTG